LIISLDIRRTRVCR